MQSTHPVGLSLRPVAHTRAPDAFPRRRKGRAWLVAGATLVLVSLGTFSHREPPSPAPRIVSGAAEIRFTERGDPERWGARDLVLWVDPTFRSVDGEAPQAVAQAVDAWQHIEQLPRVQVKTEPPRTDERAAGPAALELADLIPDGKNTVSYRRLNIPGHRRDLAITVAYANPSTGEVVEADIFVNARRDFGLLSQELDAGASCADRTRGASCGSRFDLESVVTHELGHFFGLGEDTEDPWSTMYECTSLCETHKRVLSEPDSLSATELYLTEAPRHDGTGGGCSVKRRGGAPSESLAWCALGLALIALRSRRVKA